MPSERTRTGDDPRGGTSRRSLLKSGASTLSAGLAVASAGCTAALPPLGRRVRYGRVDAPPAGDPRYLNWLPAPAAYPNEYTEATYEVLYTTPGNMGESVAGKPLSFPESLMMSLLDYFGIDYEDYDVVVKAGPALAVEAALDPDAVGSTLTDGGYDAAGSYEGYDVYTRSDVPRAALVGEGAIAFSQGKTAEGDAKALVDARAGRVDRYHEVDDDFDTFARAVGANPMSWLFDGDNNHMTDERPVTYSGTSFTFDTDAVYFVQYRLYEPGAAPTEADIKKGLDERPRPLQSAAVDVEVDGRLGTIEMRMTLDRFRKEVAGDPGDLPQVTWGVDHDPEAGTVTVVHEAGDPVDARRLDVIFRHQGPDPETEEQFTGRVRPGDSVTVDLSNAPEGDEPRVAVVYNWGEASIATLVSYSPDDEGAGRATASPSGRTVQSFK